LLDEELLENECGELERDGVEEVDAADADWMVKVAPFTMYCPGGTSATRINDPGPYSPKI
jgi:hypothetical protein